MKIKYNKCCQCAHKKDCNVQKLGAKGCTDKSVRLK